MNEILDHLYLEHHGIPAQKWGVKHGPPYPLDYEDHSPAQKKAMRKAARAQRHENKATLKGERADKYREAHTIPVGTKIYRTSVRDNEDTNGIKYVSYLDADRNHYKGGWIRQTGNADKAYEYEYELKEDLKVPSRRELSSVVNSVIKSNPTYVPKTVNAWLDMCMPEGSENRYYESVDNQGNYDKKKWNSYVKECERKFKDMSLNEAYYYTAQTFGKNKEIRGKVIDELKKRGYNAMVDEASVGGQNGYKKEGIDPLIVFDGSVLNTTNMKEISRKEEAKAKKADDKFERNSNKRKFAQWGIEFEDEKAMITYPQNDYRSYLEHHGTPGQKWGVRKAAWYPIAAFQKASNKVGTKAREFREKRAAERKRKQRAANLQKAREARAKKAQETKDFEAEKKRILTSGTPGEVIKISSKLSNQEIQDALNRNRNLEQLRAAERTRVKDIKDAEFNAKYEKLDNIARTVSKATEYANTAKGALDVYKGIKKLLEGDEPKITNIAEILKHPERATDEQIKAASIRKKYEESLGIGKENKPEAKPQQTNETGDKKPNESNTKQTESYTKSTKSDPNNKSNLHTSEDSEPRSYTKNVNSDPNAKQSHHDYEQSGSKRSNVIDGEWRDVMSSDQVSTALTVASRAMNYYDSASGQRAVKSFNNLLSGSTQKQLPDNRRNDRGQFLLEDNNKKKG